MHCTLRPVEQPIARKARDPLKARIYIYKGD